MHRYQFNPPKNVPWCANESTNTSRSSSESQSSGPGGSARMSKSPLRGRVEEAVLVARDVAGERVEQAAERAAKVDVELALGDTRLLEVEDVEEVVAERGAHGVGRLHRRRRARRDAAPVHAEGGDGVEPVGPEQRRVPRHRRAPVVADDRGALDPTASSSPTRSPTRWSWVYSPHVRRACRSARSRAGRARSRGSPPRPGRRAGVATSTSTRESRGTGPRRGRRRDPPRRCAW